jgi:FkbM family methyltransferase
VNDATGDIFACSSWDEAVFAEKLVIPAEPNESGECVLPEWARLCEVRLANATPFSMATYTAYDTVSDDICALGYWDEKDLSKYGAPGNMLDIGGNIGYFTFAFAAAGWTVTTFEPMEKNRALINATMCHNPDLASRIHINAMGLGTKSQRCRMVTPNGNVGDGIIRCRDAEEAIRDEDITAMGVQQVQGEFPVRRLDEVLLELSQKGLAQNFDFVKIDVEGYENMVFEGAPDFLSNYRPKLIKTEAWPKMVGPNGEAPGGDYLKRFEKAGYKLFLDPDCKTPLKGTDEVTLTTVNDATGDIFACSSWDEAVSVHKVVATQA